MSRIFLSHSSVDEREAVALKQWLADNGWDDVFLDVDLTRGLAVGTQWRRGLIRAVELSEAIVVLLSPAWMESRWCDRELFLASFMRKRIFGVVLQDTPRSQLPSEITAEWQFSFLAGKGSTETIRFNYRAAEDEIAFLAEGLLRLREGLRKAGLSADFFPWPPKGDPQRAPYRGLEPLEAGDAAVFFGRDVEILRGLDALRSMRNDGDKKLFVILGASGAGKSSFLRAGLLPRLERDDRHFFPLAPIRPEREPLFGERGLAHALHRAWETLKLPATNLGDIKARLREGPAGLAALLGQLQDAAHGRTLGAPEAASPPTLVLPVDQAEELFNADAGEEARSLLQLLGGVLRAAAGGDAEGIARAPLIVAFTIRSDRYEPLQTAPELAGLQSIVFDDLKPVPPTRFREVIAGPAQRASAEGKRLVVEPELVEQLVGESGEGGDTLPLLGLTLARLYRDYGGDGDLRLDEYRTMGSLANIVKTEAESVLSADEAMRRQQLELLHAAFIPWLATINSQNDQPMRRLARRADLPEGAHVLINALAEKRLLLTDRRDGAAVVEVAHEALLRQWDVLADWLATEREDLKDADVLERAAQAWRKSGCKDAWLMEGERLASAESLAAKPGFSKRLNECREFLLASGRREQAKKDEDERRRRAELEAAQRLAAEQRKRAEIEAQARRDAEALAAEQERRAKVEANARQDAEALAAAQQKRAEVEAQAKREAEASAKRLKDGRRNLMWALVVVAVVALAAIGLFLLARQSEQRAKESSARASTLRLVAEAQAIMAGKRAGNDERAILEVIAAHRLVPGGEVDAAMLDLLLQRRSLRKVIDMDDEVTAVASDAKGLRVVSGSADGRVQLWDARTGQAIGPPFPGQASYVRSVAFSPDGSRIVSGGDDNQVHVWDARDQRPSCRLPLVGHESYVSSVSFSSDDSCRLASTSNRALRLWNLCTCEPITECSPLEENIALNAAAFSPDGRHVGAAYAIRVIESGFSKAYRGAVDLWDVESEKCHRFAPLGKGEQDWVRSVAFSPDGEHLVSGGDDKTVRLWDLNIGTETVLGMHEDEIWSVAFSREGRDVVSGGKDKTLHLWHVQQNKTTQTSFEGHTAPITSVTFGKDDRIIISGSLDGTLRFWEASGHQTLNFHSVVSAGQILSVAFTGSGRAVSYSPDQDGGTLRMVDVNGGKQIGSSQTADRNALTSTAVAFSFDGSRIVSRTRIGTWRLLDATTGNPVGDQFKKENDASPTSVAFSSDGSRIASGGSDGTIRLWDAKSGSPIESPFKGDSNDAVTSIAFSPEGDKVVSGGADGTLRVWDAKRHNQLCSLPKLQGDPSSIAFSPDGQRVVSDDGTTNLLLWDATTCRLLLPSMVGHKGRVTSVAFSRDGQYIVSGSRDRTLLLWDAKTGQPLGAPLKGHPDDVLGVAFNLDGSRIISGGAGGTVQLWPGPKAWPDELCAKLTRNMSRKQWREWVSPDIKYECQCPGLPIPPDDPTSKTAPEMCPGKPAESMFPLDRPPT